MIRDVQELIMITANAVHPRLLATVLAMVMIALSACSSPPKQLSGFPYMNSDGSPGAPADFQSLN